jgi:hypothetical protein
LDRVDIGLSEIKNLGCKNLVKHTGLWIWILTSGDLTVLDC